MNTVPKTVVYVDTVQTPYNTPRLAALARDPELKMIVLLEEDQLPDRPGWMSSEIPGCRVEVIGSQLVTRHARHHDLDYDVTEVRSIPWRLPLKLYKHKPDIVVVGNATELIFAVVAKQVRKFKIALTVEDTNHTVRNLGMTWASIKRWVYRRADLHLAFSEQSEKYLKSIGLSQSIVRTSWSIDPSLFAPNSTHRVAIRGQLSLDDKVTFLFAGRLISLKGVMPMLRAWASLSPDIQGHAALVVVGDGPLRSEAQRFVRYHRLENVHFVGAVPYAQMPSYYTAADILLLPTLQDVWGLVVLEAMASGCAVMTTKYCGASYLVKEGVNGWLVEPTDDLAFSISLAAAISSRRGLSAMGSAARESVQQMDTSIVMSRVANLLKSL